MNSITITKPDDWHLHLRDEPATRVVTPYSAKQFGRALIMPNLKPPVVNAEMALAYRERILKALPKGMSFDPKMTIYLTDKTTPEMIREAAKSEYILAAKLYPANATTNSDDGVTDIWKLDRVLRTMEEVGMTLCVHGELLSDNNGEVDIFDREKHYITDVLEGLVTRYHNLKVVLEHITTREAVQFIENARDGVAATITAHHLLVNRNAIFEEGINPHNYCLPILKREEHRKALVKAATSGNSKFFAGTDSAPHARGKKVNDCGCAGCYTAIAAIELYAQAFDAVGKLNMLEAFASVHGAEFYGLPINTSKITLIKESWSIPKSIPYTPHNVLVPFWAGETLDWKIVA